MIDLLLIEESFTSIRVGLKTYRAEYIIEELHYFVFNENEKRIGRKLPVGFQYPYLVENSFLQNLAIDFKYRKNI